MIKNLNQKIEEKSAVIGVIGLGYVGLPVACLFAEAGFEVIGVDVVADRVTKIQSGISPIEGDEPGLNDLLAQVVQSGKLQATLDYADLAKADVISINVETPVDDDNKPRYVALRSACKSLAAVLKPGSLVIVESTVAPGTMTEVVQPLMEKETNYKANKELYLGHCPERVMPGKLLWNLRNLSRVCGGSSGDVSKAMVALYSHVVNADLDKSDCLSAELVKTMENAYRDVQIAFANEMALLCDAMGADVWKVRELVNKSPGRNMLLPGPGVGGHCIPKDGWLLIANAPASFEAHIIPNARRVNESMPKHLVQITVDALIQNNVSLNNAKVAVMGYAYLENSDDTRHTPTQPFVEGLTALGIASEIHDPFVSPYNHDWWKVAAGSDAIVFLVAHNQYRELDLSELKGLMRNQVLIDGRHIFDTDDVDYLGFFRRTLGSNTRTQLLTDE